MPAHDIQSPETVRESDRRMAEVASEIPRSKFPESSHYILSAMIASQGEGRALRFIRIALEQRFSKYGGCSIRAGEGALEGFHRGIARGARFGFLLDPVQHPKEGKEPLLDPCICADAVGSIDLRHLMRIAILHCGEKQDGHEI